MARKRIGIIGAGISGLSLAWMLREHHQVELLEQNDYIGGHTNTYAVAAAGGQIPVDTGFIVFNEPNYPNLTALFGELGVETRASDMSFAVSIGSGALEYAGSSVDALYAQRRNVFSPAHQRMVWDILRFNRACENDLNNGSVEGLTVDQYLAKNRLGAAFRDRYLLPMAAAIWSCPANVMGTYPMASLAQFFENHGLIKLVNRPQWRTVVGGSRRYVTRMQADLGANAEVNSGVSLVERHRDGVTVTLRNGQRRSYDQIILAAHADQSLRMLTDPSPREAALLGQFKYQRNVAVLHTDARLMPRNRRVWSSWNYLSDTDSHSDGDRQVSVTYWMNRLQGLTARRDYLVSLNPLQTPDARQVLAEFEYHHPVFNTAAITSQSRLNELQGVNRTWFCGSYFGYGFHEDALASSIAVARALGATPAWLPNVGTASPLSTTTPLVTQPQGA